VIGGYIPGPHGFDALLVRYYQNKDLMYDKDARSAVKEQP